MMYPRVYPRVLLGLVCLLLVPCSLGAVSHQNWGAQLGEENSAIADGLIEGRQHNSTWICHYSQGVGGVVNKSKCTASNSNSTGDHKDYLGYIGALVAVVFFGSNFVPVKKYETGDGVFFQWVLCVGIWLVGLLVNFILDSPLFFLPTVLGGFLWTTGNMLVVPIIKMIGLTMGLTVWGVTNMLSGWVVGRFILDQDVGCSGLNYGGVATVVLSVFILAFVKSEGKTGSSEGNFSERSPLLGDKPPSLDGSLVQRVRGCCMNVFQLQRSGESSPTSINSDNKVTFSTSVNKGTLNPESSDESWVDRLGVWHKRILGFSLSLMAGLVFSFLFLPVQFLKLCDDSAHSCSDLDYLFGVYSGILFTSTFYFFTYSALSRNKPKVYPSIIFPGIISGLFWGIAMAGWFLANQHLSLAISFPLVTAGPGFISSGWGILLYREIKGRRNIGLFFVAFSVSLTGLVMNGLSKSTVHC